MITADNISFDSDEGRFTMIVQGDEGDTIIVDIHNVALDFYAQVRREMDDYVADAESARKAVASGMSRADYLDSPQPVRSRPVSVEDAIEAGYALDDPKSPGYHDRMVGDH
jgi:hypothetical protein